MNDQLLRQELTKARREVDRAARRLARVEALLFPETGDLPPEE